MFGIRRKPDPLFLLGLFVGVAALFTTAAGANETPGYASYQATDSGLPVLSSIVYEKSSGFVVTKNRKGDGFFISFSTADDTRNTLLETGAGSEREIKDLLDIDVKLSYKLTW